MRSDVLIVASVGSAPRIECTGGLAARRTEANTVHLVSAAATPLGGDSITVRVIAEAGAVLRVRTVAATVTLPGRETVESRSEWDIQAAGEVDIDPQPTVVAGASRHLASTRVHVAETGRVRVRERVQIGRTGEWEGFWSGSLHADVEGRALLRHRVEMGTGSVTDDELGTPRACISEMRYPADYPAGAFDPGGTLLALAGGGCLATWQGTQLPA